MDSSGLMSPAQVAGGLPWSVARLASAGVQPLVLSDHAEVRALAPRLALPWHWFAQSPAFPALARTLGRPPRDHNPALAAALLEAACAVCERPPPTPPATEIEAALRTFAALAAPRARATEAGPDCEPADSAALRVRATAAALRVLSSPAECPCADARAAAAAALGVLGAFARPPPLHLRTAEEKGNEEEGEREEEEGNEEEGVKEKAGGEQGYTAGEILGARVRQEAAAPLEARPEAGLAAALAADPAPSVRRAAAEALGAAPGPRRAASVRALAAAAGADADPECRRAAVDALAAVLHSSLQVRTACLAVPPPRPAWGLPAQGAEKPTWSTLLPV